MSFVSLLRLWKEGVHALIRSKFIDDGGVSCYADPATSRWASVWKVNGIMRYAEYAWQQIDWNASPVGRFFGERNHKSSTDSNCRNLTILVVSRSASATFLESANICSIDSVVRSVASWCIASFHNNFGVPSVTLAAQAAKSTEQQR